MRRIVEGQSRSEDPSTRVDAFSRAILNEKDPVIRGYVENLRSQIATIAANHGANARDVWNKEVQDRMSVDEMDAVNALFKRIKAMSEKKVSGVDASRMERELAEKESAAQEMLDDALDLPDLSTTTLTDIGQLFLDAGMVEDARTFSENYLFQQDAFDIKLLLAEAADIARVSPSSENRIHFLRKAMNHAYEHSRDVDNSYDSSMEVFLSVYNPLVRLLSDQQLWDEATVLIAVDSAFVQAVKAPCLEIELERRGLPRSGTLTKITDNVLVVLQDDLGEEEITEYFLHVAEFRAKHGFDYTESLEVAIANAKEINHFEMSGAECVGSIIRFAAKLGEFDLIESIAANPWWTGVGSKTVVNVHAAAAMGCVDAGNFEKAIEFLRAENGKESLKMRMAVRHLSEAYLKRNDIRRADEIVAELDPEELDWFWQGIKYIAARARRGDDVLAEVQVIAEDSVVNHPMYNPRSPDYGTKAVHLANAAIATIWNVREMRKRIAEYAKR